MKAAREQKVCILPAGPERDVILEINISSGKWRPSRNGILSGGGLS
jgi:hypothetical protein